MSEEPLMLMAEPAQNRRYRAPAKSGRRLVEPPEAELPEQIAHNRQHLAAVNYDVQGRPLGELSASARRSFLQAAVEYTRADGDLPHGGASLDTLASGPIVLSGHQPQLFHAGVWYKNFLLGHLADRVDGVGIHLLIDSDLCRAASIRVPTGSVDQPRVEAVPFDQLDAEMPFEERTVQDEATVASFAARVEDSLRPLVSQPLVGELWSRLPGRGEEPNLGRRLARGRHRLEVDWGNTTLELPQSTVCQLEEFHWFVAHVLAHLPRFWSAYNEAVAAYRAAHRLRNRAHPVPDLADDHGWLEAPFWMWSSAAPRRQPVFARQVGDEVVLTDRGTNSLSLTLSADGDADRAVAQLADWAARGVKLRTRALATTLFARLLLGDLFVHGIGGAKYDQVTDQLAEAFFGFTLPEYAVASATMRLPIRHAAAGRQDWQAVQRELRDWEFHPERFLADEPSPAPDQMSSARSAVEEKHRWIETPRTPENARRRHRAIVAANHSLHSVLAPQRERLLAKRQRVEYRARANAILDSREYAFCLFPRKLLQEQLVSGR